MTIQSGTHAIESSQLEERRCPPPPEFAKKAKANVSGLSRWRSWQPDGPPPAIVSRAAALG
jgi:hypothetical protein